MGDIYRDCSRLQEGNDLSVRVFRGNGEVNIQETQEYNYVSIYHTSE